MFTDACIGTVIQQAGVSLAEAVDMASARPRELLGLSQVRLEPGYPADLILFDWQPGGDLAIRTVIIEGVPDRPATAPSTGLNQADHP